jgi:hypothetical protein
MNAQSSSAPPTSTAAARIPRHWTPEQALAVFECLQLLRQALWEAYGPQVQQAWREQLAPDEPPPEFDPDEPF